mmetsp:Transcript_55373/g.160761  ORF Transcript_55373/g.160761 Transcript_55373/m.160761 type:complete len:241 (-) Transcript_55373:822-1544(-)
MICQAPRFANLRSKGSRARSSCATGAAGPPRTTSSGKMARMASATCRRRPRPSAGARTAAVQRSLWLASSRCRRSMAALASSAHSRRCSSPVLASEATAAASAAWRNCFRHSTSSWLAPLDIAKFSSASAAMRTASPGHASATRAKQPSMVVRTAPSRAKSRYSTSFSLSPMSAPPAKAVHGRSSHRASIMGSRASTGSPPCLACSAPRCARPSNLRSCAVATGAIGATCTATPLHEDCE